MHRISKTMLKNCRIERFPVKRSRQTCLPFVRYNVILDERSFCTYCFVETEDIHRSSLFFLFFFIVVFLSNVIYSYRSNVIVITIKL